MKKIFVMALLFTAATACNNNSNEASADDDSTVRTAPAVENVNGNIPDTTNTIDVGTNDGSVSQ
ncbi:MAG: hypothetical protein ACO1NX_09905 [Chitinophagaceae bacterium]